MDCMHHPCVHRLGDIVHRRNNIDQWQTTSSTRCMHQKRHVHIEWVLLIVDCSHWPGYINQQQRELDKLFMHLMLFVNIWKATSDNGMQHHSTNDHIINGVCEFARRHRRRHRRHICQGMYVLASDVGQCQVASPKACPHLTWHVYIWKKRCPLEYNIRYGIYTWVMASMHRQADNCIFIRQAVSAKVGALRESDV